MHRYVVTVFVTFIVGSALLENSVVHSIGCDKLNYLYTDSIDLDVAAQESVSSDSSGGTRMVTKYQQKWKGVEVFGYGGTYDSATGEIITFQFANCIHVDLDDAIPAVSDKAALDVAYSNLKIHAQDEFFEPSDLKNYRLIIMVGTVDNIARLVYRFDIIYQKYNNGNPETISVITIINAKTGAFISAQEYARALTMKGDGGNEKFGFYRYGEGAWADRLLDVTKGKKQTCVLQNEQVEVISAAQRSLFVKMQCFDSNMAVFSETCDPPAGNSQLQIQAHDALYFATKWIQILNDTYNMDLVNNCTAVQVCVHYKTANTAEFMYRDNSQWGKYEGQTCHLIFSTASTFARSLVAPSSVAHELCHGVMDVNGLFDSGRQPFAVYEAFADFCGALFKSHITGSVNPDWHVGSEVFINAGDQTALRYMDDPPKDSMSIGCTKQYGKFVTETAPNIYNPQHFLNGIYNKAFYHLIETEGLSKEEVFKILLRAVTYYWSPIMNFDSRLCGILEAAIDPFGAKINTETKALTTKITNAFSRVGVHCGVKKKRKKFVTKIGCPAKWTTFKEVFEGENDIVRHCFQLVQLNYTQNKAKTYCKNKNAQLMQIDSKEKLKWARNMMPNIEGVAAYVGGKYDIIDSKWKWQPSGTPMSWVGKKEPTEDSEIYSCVTLAKSTNQNALGNNNLDPDSDLFHTISNKTRNEESGRIEDGHSLTESENVSATDEESDLSTGEKREAKYIVEWQKSRCKEKRWFICELSCS